MYTDRKTAEEKKHLEKYEFSSSCPLKKNMHQTQVPYFRNTHIHIVYYCSAAFH